MNDCASTPTSEEKVLLQSFGKFGPNSNGNLTNWDITGYHLVTKWCQLDPNRCLMHPALCTHLNLIIQSDVTLKLPQQEVSSHFLPDHNPATDPNTNTFFLFIFCCVFGPRGHVAQGLSAASCSVHRPSSIAPDQLTHTHTRSAVSPSGSRIL